MPVGSRVKSSTAQNHNDADRKVIQGQAHGEKIVESGTKGDWCWQWMAQVLAIADVERKEWGIMAGCGRH